ncbi:chemotaxis protein CheA [Silanimonas sp.]|jgi:two-component system chemotaxis sensor kinase CheA|uniref:chemotaxis protein CheA n=1 Tax=Silanimonas sp. TaxID=1929290 RepID=UPI0037CC790F
MSAVSPDIAADFLVEAGEILERLGEQLVQLEQAADDKGLLNAVFRGFHTIKGGAGFLGLVPMVELCHALEDAFDKAREGKILLDDDAFDYAQRCHDTLTVQMAALGAGQPLEPADPDLIAAIKAWASGQTTTKPAKAAAAKAAPKPGAKAAGPAKTGGDTEQTVRVDTKRLDAIVNLTGELVLARNRLKVLRDKLKDEDLHRAVTALDHATARLQGSVMRTRMQPVSRVFQRFPKMARDVARQLDKQVELTLEGAETELDRNLVEALADPLVHLVRNAIDHGVERPAVRQAAGKNPMGQVFLSARQEGDAVAIEIRDDGGGMDPEKLRAKAVEKGLLTPEAAARLGAEDCFQLIFMPGFSTKVEVTDISGRGVGMDVVQSKIRELSGQIQIQSELGQGSRFTIRVPLTLAILPTLLVRVADTTYALPLGRVVEVLPMPQRKPDYVDGQPVLDLRSNTLPLVWLRAWLRVPPCENGEVIVVLQTGDFRYGLVVDQVRGREEVVIKALPKRVRGLLGYAGATLIGDGSLALILDVDGIQRSVSSGNNRLKRA